MIPDWQTNTVFFSSLLPDRYGEMWARLHEILQQHSVPVNLLERTRDIWMRDYCPIQVGPGRFVKFRYNPDYLRYAPRLRTRDEICQELEHLGQIQMSPIVLDGGNVVGTAQTAVLTEKVFPENPNYPRDRLQADLVKLLEVEQCIFIPIETGDRFGHSDGMLRFLTPQLVVLNDYTQIEPGLGHSIRELLTEAGFEVEPMPYRPPEEDPQEAYRADAVPSAKGNYVNFLRVGDLIVVPAYDSPEDEVACRTLERLCPTAKVVSLDAQELAEDGGVFNCISWTITVPRSAGDHGATEETERCACRPRPEGH